jgi:hypothetical protein
VTTYLDGLQIEMHPDAVLFHTRSGKAYGREHMRSVGSAVIPRSYFWRTLRAKTQRSYLEGWGALGCLRGAFAFPSIARPAKRSDAENAGVDDGTDAERDEIQDRQATLEREPAVGGWSPLDGAFHSLAARKLWRT